MSDKKCEALNHPNLAPSWACCCRTLNGNHRKECKECGHKRCDKPAQVVVVTLGNPEDFIPKDKNEIN